MTRRGPGRGGFTAIEMLTTILVITILMGVVLVPAWMRIHNRAAEAQVKANAVNLQKMLERFRMGKYRYPTTLDELDADATDYNVELTNPFTGARGKVGSKKWAVKITTENVPLPGFVGYKYLGPTAYELYGYNRDGGLLKDDRDQVYVIRSV